MRASANKKLAGLRRYHTARPARTRLKLLEALDRMESGHTVVVGSEFKWSKTTLALEAGVNVNTVVRKLPGGQWVFPEINERFDQLKGKRGRSTMGSDPREEKIAELRGEVERLKDQNGCLPWKSIASESRSYKRGSGPIEWPSTSSRTLPCVRRSCASKGMARLP